LESDPFQGQLAVSKGQGGVPNQAATRSTGGGSTNRQKPASMALKKAH